MASGDHDNQNGSSSNGAMNGSAELAPLDEKEVALLAAPPPAAVLDLAEACIRYVERAVGVKLDFTVETLPLLDHYVAGARDVLSGRARPDDGAEPIDLVAQAAGAYLGEVIRRRYPSWWRVGAEGVDARLEFHRLYLVVQPVTLIHEALVLDSAAGDLESKQKGMHELGGFDMDEDDKEAASARLAELPEVPVEEFVAPSTRVEVLDIVIDAVRVLHLQAGRPLALAPSDYAH